ncbi:MAG: DUF3459 domain-containing protein [Kiritimatiellae bacterium]|nr:DUF3459 domain-containing protein [Kiritimatiellia bacterium]
MQSWIPYAILYQVNLRSFAAREPRNPVEAAREKPATESPLAYLARHLPVVRRLGANVVYLMPLYPMGLAQRKGIGSPYSIRDFRGVDPEHGTIEELAALVRRAHELDLRVILDITPNHTSRDHHWITSHPDYYIKNANGEIHHDLDWTDTAKLDYTNPGLRREMIEVYDFWLRLLGPDSSGKPDGLDGFRLDMAHFINDLSFWDEAMPTLRARHPDRDLLFLAECYGSYSNKDLFRRGINAAYDDDFYKFCLYFYGVTENGESVISPSPDAASNPDFADKLEAFTTRGLAGAMEKILLNYEDVAPGPVEQGPFLARYTDNHDEGRGLHRFGEGAVKAVNRLLFLSNRCLPFLLAGQEFGALNRPPIHNRIATCEKGPRVLHGDRIEAHPGVEFEGNLFARTAEARAEWYAFYRELIRLRLRHPALVYGTLRLLDAGEDCPPSGCCVVAFERRWKRTVARCAVNLGPEPRVLKNAVLFTGKLLYGGLTDAVLPPFSTVVTRP